MTDAPLWTLDELAARVAAALAVGYPGAPSARVRDVPDPRTIRWYTTRGLVDPPVAMRGRQALYGRRHLLQLVALKRRQAAGAPLAEIQVELAGLTDALLAEIAGVPGTMGGTSGQPPGGPDLIPAHPSRPAVTLEGSTAAHPDDPGRLSGGGTVTDSGPHHREGDQPRVRFWAGAPAPTPPVSIPAADHQVHSLGLTLATPPAPAVPARIAAPNGDLMQGIRLADGVALLIDVGLVGAAPLDITALRTAAAPLLALLGATQPGRTDRTDEPAPVEDPALTHDPDPTHDPGRIPDRVRTPDRARTDDGGIGR